MSLQIRQLWHFSQDYFQIIAQLPMPIVITHSEPTFVPILIFLLYRLWRNILADKPRVTKFPIEWDQVKEEADMGAEQQLHEGVAQFGVTPSIGTEGTAPSIAGGDTDMQMD